MSRVAATAARIDDRTFTADGLANLAGNLHARVSALASRFSAFLSPSAAIAGRRAVTTTAGLGTAGTDPVRTRVAGADTSTRATVAPTVLAAVGTPVRRTPTGSKPGGGSPAVG